MKLRGFIFFELDFQRCPLSSCLAPIILAPNSLGHLLKPVQVSLTLVEYLDGRSQFRVPVITIPPTQRSENFSKEIKVFDNIFQIR